MDHLRRLCLPLLLGLSACAVAAPTDYEVAETGGGLPFDQDNPEADLSPKFDVQRQYEVPVWVQEVELESPEIRVSLDGLSVHLFDRGTGLSRVYPTGPGALAQSSGLSFTPTGFFATSPDPSPSWWNLSQRFTPDYFGGFPFLRLTTHNSEGQNTYGFHGPITYRCEVEVASHSDCPLEERSWFLVHDFVSHGCMRMNAADIVELYYLIQGHPSVPVTIQQEVELDDEGVEILPLSHAIDWPLAENVEETVYGELGARPESWDPCKMPDEWSLHSYGC